LGALLLRAQLEVTLDLYQRLRRLTHGGFGVVTFGACQTWLSAPIPRDDQISYADYRIPPVIIQQAIWLYLRFALTFRDVENLLAERGIVVSHETASLAVGSHFGVRMNTPAHSLKLRFVVITTLVRS
jgi:hypothetical protein